MPGYNHSTIWTDSQKMSNQNYQVHYYKNKDFKSVALHAHDFFETYLFIKGNATYIVEHNRYILSPGDILIIPPNTLHQLYIRDSSEEYERYVLWLNANYIDSLSSSKTNLAQQLSEVKTSNNYLIHNAQLSTTVCKLMKELILLDNDHSFGMDIASNIAITNILLSINKYLLSGIDNITLTYNTKSQNPRISEIISLVDNNLAGDLTLDNIANQLFISKYYLTRLFKNETGTPLHQYIVKKRLVYAKELINQNMPISKVFQKAGFSDYSHFFRAFKNEFHVTPKEYLLLKL